MGNNRDAKILPTDKKVLEQSGGTPLPLSTKLSLEAELRVKLDDIRVHTGPNAQQITQRIGAKSFAVGSHIVFAPGVYQPNSPTAKQMLKHEIAHTLQQRGNN